MQAISTHALHFAFRPRKPLLQDINLSVPEGSIYGLIGLNGAGKSTLLKLLGGLLNPRSGERSVLGQSLDPFPVALYQRMGIMIEGPQLYSHLTARQHLDVFATYRRLPATLIRQVLQDVRLEKQADQKISTFSTGMKKRLAIATTLLGNPELLLLDEPTNGLDAGGIIDLRNLLVRLNRREGRTIVLASHLLSELEQVCTHIGILHEGQLVYQDSLEALRRLYHKGLTLMLEVSQTEYAAKLLREQFFPVEMTEAGQLAVSIKDRSDVNRINDLLRAAEINLYHLEVRTPKLESVFMEIVNGNKK